ncbi:MAG: protein translocase subunit SecF [Candidatus Campbellbacteria bacterium]|nr:protein translocase subunit SecF [Candidatus Campbellbacteria bacterium]
MFIARNRKIFLGIGLTLVVLSLLSVLIFGLRFSVEFTGGSIIEVSVEGNEVEKETITEAVSENLPEDRAMVQEFGDSGFVIRTPFLDEDIHAGVTNALTSIEGVTIDRESSVGPTIGSELRQKSIIAISIVVVLIVLFVAFAFRHVSKPISSWMYGGATIATLIHDITVTTGVFTILGVVAGAEVDSLFVVALLTILGYSVNDTIVVFDRIRENLRRNEEKNNEEDFETTIGHSIDQTITRSINTSLTTSLALLSLYVFGGSTTQIFALTLLVGVIAGTYSSIFFASPLLITIERWRYNRKQK